MSDTGGSSDSSGAGGYMGCAVVFMVIGNPTLYYLFALIFSDIEDGYFLFMGKFLLSSVLYIVLLVVGGGAAVLLCTFPFSLARKINARRMTYFATEFSHEFDELEESLGSAGAYMAFAAILATLAVALVLHLAGVRSLFWVVAIGLGLSIAGFYGILLHRTYNSPGMGHRDFWVFSQVRAYMLPYVVVTAPVCALLGILLYTFIHLGSYLIVFSNLIHIDWIGIYGLIVDLFAIPPWEIDFRGLAEGMAWSMALGLSVVWVLPIIVKRAYGEIALITLAVATPLLAPYAEQIGAPVVAALRGLLGNVPPPVTTVIIILLIDFSFGYVKDRMKFTEACRQCGNGLTKEWRYCPVCATPRKRIAGGEPDKAPCAPEQADL